MLYSHFFKEMKKKSKIILPNKTSVIALQEPNVKQVINKEIPKLKKDIY